MILWDTGELGRPHVSLRKMVLRLCSFVMSNWYPEKAEHLVKCNSCYRRKLISFYAPSFSSLHRNRLQKENSEVLFSSFSVTTLWHRVAVSRKRHELCSSWNHTRCLQPEQVLMKHQLWLELIWQELDFFLSLMQKVAYLKWILFQNRTTHLGKN